MFFSSYLDIELVVLLIRTIVPLTIIINSASSQSNSPPRIDLHWLFQQRAFVDIWGLHSVLSGSNYISKHDICRISFNFGYMHVHKITFCHIRSFNICSKLFKPCYDNIRQKLMA